MNKFFKKTILFLLVLSFVTPVFYVPQFAPRANAVIPVIDWKQLVKDIVDGVAMGIAKRMVDDTVRSTVKWAQSGFEGNPAYVINPTQFYTDIADGVAGDFILGNESLGFLCSPFRENIRISLIQDYYEPQPFQCTLTEVVDNIEDFYNDFSKGGWDAWFSMTQNPTNNPYGAYLAAKVELDSRIANALNLEREQLNWNSGFLSWSECLEWEELPGPTQDGQPLRGKCLKPGPVQTPGSTIKAQLDKVLPSGLEQLINVEHIEQLISAFASGLLNRYVFNSQKGLLASGSSGQANSRDFIDFDNDGISDGWDYNLDGQVDYCNHGFKVGLPSGSQPNNTNCNGSSEVTSSPYFIPFCEDLRVATKEAESLYQFVTAVKFMGKNDAPLWFSKISSYASAMERLQNSLLRFDIRAFDEALRVISGEVSFANDHVDKLAGESRLAYNPGDDRSADGFRQWLPGVIQYLKDFKTAINRCDNPNISAAGAIIPPNNPHPTDSGGENPTPTPPSGGEQPASLLSDVQAERAKYGAVPTDEELGLILNAVAWKNRDAGWGLSFKNSGRYINSPAGPIAEDILHHQPTNIIVDVFTGAGAQAEPTWDVLGQQTDVSRPWVAPVEP